jgi:TBCC domain-containing protein 1
MHLRRQQRAETSAPQQQHQPVAQSGGYNPIGRGPVLQQPSAPLDLTSMSGGIGTTATTTGSTVGGSNLVFCVSPLLFETTGLLLDSPSGLTASAVARLRQECPTTTTISLSDWKDIATNSLGLKDNIAVSLFEAYYSLTISKNENRLEQTRVLLGRMGGVTDETKWPVAGSQRLVSLPGLSLFLLTQIFLERPPRAPVGEANNDTILTFVKQHLHDIIATTAVTKPGRVSLADAAELQILLREFANGVEQPFGTSISFLWPRAEKTIDVAVLSQFLRPRIVLPQDIKPNGVFPNNVTVRHLTSTVHILPAPMMPAQSTQPPSAKFSSATFRLVKCSQTTFYVTSDLPNTLLSSLVNCTVAIGPVCGVLCVDRCENVHISAVCAGLVVTNCKNVVLNVCTNTPPVLLMKDGALENVRLAPYNSHYSTLEEHLNATGINPKLNLWRCGVPTSMHLPPEEFSSVSFPIAPQAAAVVTTRTNPCAMPPEYINALNQRVTKFNQVSSQLQSAYKQLEAAGRRDLAESLRGKVQNMFLDWLYDSGQAKGLLDLLHQSQTSATGGLQPSTAATTHLSGNR